MKTEQVRLAAQSWVEGSTGRYLVAIGAESDFGGHIRAFEAGMSQLVQAARDLVAGVQLALALPFTPVEQAADHSYRRALKKYARSPVFVDLNIFLVFVRKDKSIQVLPPHKVNDFLTNLNTFILRERSK